MKVKISHAHMHQAAFIPGLKKHTTKGLDSQTVPGIQMFLLDNGLLECHFEKDVVYIPSTNFQSLVAAPEEGPKKEAKK